MTYEPPRLHHEGALCEVLHRLVPKPGQVKAATDWRVRALLEDIEKRTGIDWDLKHSCSELKLDISAAHAARLFKRCTGVGVREFAKNKRLLAAAKRLTTTDLPIKVIAADLGYRNPVDFTRIFKERYRLNPTQFRKHVA